MNEAHSSGSNGGFRPGTLSPDELDKLAALFVPTWEQPIEGAAPPDDVMRAASAPATAPAPAIAIAPAAAPAPAPHVALEKKTMMGIAAPRPQEPEAPFVPPQRAVDPHGPTAALDLGVVQAKPAIIAPKPVAYTPPTSLADSSTDIAALSRKRSPIPFVVGGVVLLGALGIFLATRGGDAPAPKSEGSAQVTESKPLDLPDPNVVAPTKATAAANTATATATATATTGTTGTAGTTAAAAATTTAAPTVEDQPTATAAPAKTAEPPPAPTPKATATAAPKPTAAPTPKATAAPKPPPATTAKPKKSPQKIKDEF